MTKAEMHYLNCDDEDCEKFACIARRDYEHQLEIMESEVSLLAAKVKELSYEIMDLRDEL